MPPKECERFKDSHNQIGQDDDEPLVFRPQATNTSSRDEPRKPRVWDFLLLLGGGLLLTTHVEANAAHTESGAIIDRGFMLTQKLYELLASNQQLNDCLAFINSLALLLPLFYTIYVTKFRGDYQLFFRIIFSQLLRSACGYVTHIAPDKHYLASHYDYPDIIHCLSQECVGEPQVMPFISFFSGHVTNMVITGNDAWVRDLKPVSLLLHFLNAFQVVRMLATRGHYTIDLVMGWVVAVYFSSGAAAMGRAYNRGTPLWELLPWSWSDFVATVTGVAFVRDDQERPPPQWRKRQGKQQVEELLLSLGRNEGDEQTETTMSLSSLSRSSSSYDGSSESSS